MAPGAVVSEERSDESNHSNPGEPTRPAQAFPIPLQSYHLCDLEIILQRMATELQMVRQRPTAWRWVVASTYDALDHAPAAHQVNFTHSAGLNLL